MILTAYQLLCVFLMGWHCLWPVHDPSPKPSTFRVYLFIGETCVATKHFAPHLRELHHEYSSQGFEFIGLFPNGYSTTEGIEAFQAKYQLPFALRLDTNKAKARQFGTTYIPEVVIWEVAQRKIRYQGRIDDIYMPSGLKRLKATTHELADALAALAQGNPVSVSRTQTAGCFISDIPICR